MPRAFSGMAETDGIAEQMGHGGDAAAIHQLDQQLVGAQIERDDAGRRRLRPHLAHACEHGQRRGQHHARCKPGAAHVRSSLVCYGLAQLPPMPSLPPNVSFTPAKAVMGAA